MTILITHSILVRFPVPDKVLDKKFDLNDLPANIVLEDSYHGAILWALLTEMNKAGFITDGGPS